MYPSKSFHKKTKPISDRNVALTAAALQDHLVRNLALSDPLNSRRKLTSKRPTIKKEIKAVVDTGRERNRTPNTNGKEIEVEKILDDRPPSLSLAQKLGLVQAPPSLLTEDEWSKVKEASKQRDDSVLPCVICKEDFGLQDQVILSCSHVFHRSCLEAFERFTGKKTCPMCRKEQYQKRLIHEGSRSYKQKCATRIQAWWRGHVVRVWYLKLRETTPPSDPKLRQKFYEERLHTITDRMIRSFDNDISSFIDQLEQSVEASRDVFKQLDAKLMILTEDEWLAIQAKAVERCETDCPICLNQLQSLSLIEENALSNDSNITRKLQNKLRRPHGARKTGVRKETLLLSCSHVFHATCLEAFEDFSEGEKRFVCPVCRSHYQKKIL
ncbi:hypothetical protein CAPTEDRAFT_222016 [Capitella teleta]|uniref:RING-type domain-containing protein n=1 Tax=Capitella teleta TaxID=283909 RepID=R7UEP1_CAPTE|nr:hypothetical protein CAPTEDRAFT_222016 [Capitella teleta]|eukprot:ELU01747.1 hypothetical protein CAPTEDRAFT_222016 [Capitella teleta]